MQERQIGGYTTRGSQYYQVPARRAPAPQPPRPEEPSNRPPRKLRSSKKRLWWIIPLVLIALGGAGFGAYALMKKPASPLPPSVANQINFTPYVPDDSRGVSVDQNSYVWQQGVLTFTAHTPSNNQVFISEQLVPKDFDLTSFLQHIKDKQTLTNKFGNGDAGISENNLVISEVINNTWIFMSGPINMDASQLGLVFYSLHK